MSRLTSRHVYLAALLLVSLLLRWLLVFQGGQYYFSDEQRYETSQQVAGSLLEGRWAEAGGELLQMPEHLGYKAIGLLPAFLEYIIGGSIVLPAMFFSVFSVINLYLIFLLARRLGASSAEALLALIIASMCQSLFYYSRHLMPYDVAMTFGLLALYVGLADDPRRRASFFCGVLGVLCFITYNGYWALAALAMLVHLLRGVDSFRGILQRGILSAVGFSLPVLMLTFYAAQLGIDLPGEFSRFARTVTQGDYAEGWSLPFAYFWHAEYLLFVVLMLSAGNAVWRGSNRQAVLLWGGCVVFLYVCLVVPAVFFHALVVLGRLARQLLPFLILLSANGLIGLLQQGVVGRRIGLALMLVAVAQAALNFNGTFHVAFPKDFVREVQTGYPDFEFSPKRFLFGAPEICENNGYAVQNAKYFLAVPESTQTIPGTVLLASPHPVNFLPYQYEGYTPEQRQAFRKAQLEMTFYRLDRSLMENADLKKSGIPSCIAK